MPKKISYQEKKFSEAKSKKALGREVTSTEAGGNPRGWGHAFISWRARSLQFQWAAHGRQETKLQSGERWEVRKMENILGKRVTQEICQERIMTRDRAGLSLGCGGWGINLPWEFFATASITQVLCRCLPYLF